jgi:hypothetical protein
MPLGNIKLSQHSEQRLELTDSLLVKTVGILGFSLLLLAAIFITSVSWLLAAFCCCLAGWLGGFGRPQLTIRPRRWRAGTPPSHVWNSVAVGGAAVPSACGGGGSTSQRLISMLPGSPNWR